MRSQRAAVSVQGGNGKTDELTFEQPEEIAFAKVKPDGAAVIRNLSGRSFSAPTKVVPRVKLFPVFRRDSEDGIFLFFAKNKSKKLFQIKLEEPKNERL